MDVDHELLAFHEAGADARPGCLQLIVHVLVDQILMNDSLDDSDLRSGGHLVPPIQLLDYLIERFDEKRHRTERVGAGEPLLRASVRRCPYTCAVCRRLCHSDPTRSILNKTGFMASSAARATASGVGAWQKLPLLPSARPHCGRDRTAAAPTQSHSDR
jgi:hypothetical protein